MFPPFEKDVKNKGDEEGGGVPPAPPGRVSDKKSQWRELPACNARIKFGKGGAQFSGEKEAKKENAEMK